MSTIRAREAVFLQRAVEAWQQEPAIEILGNLDAERLSIVSFMVRTTGGRHLHHNFVVSRAQRPLRHPGPGWLLLRRPLRARPARHRPRALARVRERDRAGLRGSNPAGCGSTSTTSSPTPSPTTSSRPWPVARDGWRLLGDYAFDAASGLWRHHDGPVEPPLRLRQVGVAVAGLRYPRQHDRAGEEALSEHLEQGRHILAAAAPAPPRCHRQRGLRPPAVVRPARDERAERDPPFGSTPGGAVRLRNGPRGRPGHPRPALPLPAQPHLGSLRSSSSAVRAG